MWGYGTRSKYEDGTEQLVWEYSTTSKYGDRTSQFTSTQTKQSGHTGSVHPGARALEGGHGAITRVAQIEAFPKDAAVAGPFTAMAWEEGPRVETVLAVVVRVVHDVVRKTAVVPAVVHLPPVSHKEEVVVYIIPA